MVDVDEPALASSDIKRMGEVMTMVNRRRVVSNKGDPAEDSETPTTSRSCRRSNHFPHHTGMIAILGCTISEP